MRLDRAELGLDAGADLFEGARGDLILQAFELAPEFFGEKVGEDREELADLDEQPLEGEDGRLDAASVLSVDVGHPLCPVRAPESARLDRKPDVAPEDEEGRCVGVQKAPTARGGSA